MNESPTPSSKPERWLPVPGYEGSYEVSDRGRVRSLSRFDFAGRWRVGQLLRPSEHGYPHVVLHLDGKARTRKVHSLVARAFLGPRPKGYIVCHGPGGEQDSSVANLSYGTQAKNLGPDRRRDGTTYCGGAHHLAKLTEEIVWVCRIRAEAGETKAALAREFGVSKPAMTLAVNGRTWSHVPFPDTAEPPAA